IFLIEIELWQIDDSFPAPKFNVVSKPNDWAKALKVESNLSETKQMQYRFWQAFRNYANGTDFVHTFTLRKARPQHWYDLSDKIIRTQMDSIPAAFFLQKQYTSI